MKLGKTVLDLGCGPGLGAKIVLTSIANSPMTYVASDLSSEMLNIVKGGIEKSDFLLNKNNKFVESKSKEETEEILKVPNES